MWLPLSSHSIRAPHAPFRLKPSLDKAPDAPERVEEPEATRSNSSPIITAASVRGFEGTVKPFLSEYCYPCHGNKGEPKNGLNLQSFQVADTLIGQRDHWEDVIGMLRRGDMPPMEEEQPEESRRQAVAAWLEDELERIDRVTPPDPGRVTARRLNRAEYNNTIRELLGVDLRPADDFPQDDAGYGFDNIADVLSLSPVLMEKYLTAADAVARTAVFGPEPLKPTLTRLRSEGRKNGDARVFPLDYDVTGISLPNAFHALHRIPVEGEYLVKVFLGGQRPANSDPISVSLWIDDRETLTVVHDQEKYGRFDLDRQDFGGQTAEFRIRLTAGEHRIAVAIPRIFEGLPARFYGPNPSKRPDPPRTFTPPANAPPERITLLKQRFDEAQAEIDKIPFNGVRVANVEVGGPCTPAVTPTANISPRARAGSSPASRGARSGARCRPRRSTSTCPSSERRNRKNSPSRKGWSSAFPRCWFRRTSSSGSSGTGRSRPPRRLTGSPSTS
jgi:hypothetical protein